MAESQQPLEAAEWFTPRTKRIFTVYIVFLRGPHGVQDELRIVRYIRKHFCRTWVGPFTETTGESVSWREQVIVDAETLSFESADACRRTDEELHSLVRCMCRDVMRTFAEANPDSLFSWTLEYQVYGAGEIDRLMSHEEHLRHSTFEDSF